MYTSRYSYNPKKLDTRKMVGVMISIGKPKWRLGYKTVEMGLLAPWGVFKVYEGAEFNQKYLERLDKIGIDKIRAEIDKIKFMNKNKELVFLCWEDITKANCHRRLFAEWYEKKTGEKIPELEEVEAEKPSKRQLGIW